MHYSEPPGYQPSLLTQPAFAYLLALFPELQGQAWPTLAWLNANFQRLTGDNTIRFVTDADVAELGLSQLYYEELIAKHGLVLTRECNWHDLFNALIWMLFPKSKWQISQQHLEDIQTHGLNPRTPRRNRLTHFDECGVVLAFTDTSLPKALAEHSWLESMHIRKGDWGRVVTPMMFGHANYEMLLNPFIGLTGKWLGIEVGAEFHHLSYSRQCETIDLALSQVLEEQDPMSSRGNLKPLPLLGVPGWYAPNTVADFYRNVDYFRPKRGAA